MGERLAGVGGLASGIGGQQASVDDEGVGGGDVEGEREGEEILVLEGGHVVCELVMVAKELPALGDLPPPRGPVVPGLGIDPVVEVDAVALCVEPVAVLLCEPLEAALLGGYPVEPGAPFDDGLVVVAADAGDVVGRHVGEDGEGAGVGSPGEDVADVDEDV